MGIFSQDLRIILLVKMGLVEFRRFLMRIDVYTRDDISVVEVSGDILFSNWKEFVEKVSGLIEKGHNQILLSLEKVNYFDSSAMGGFICIYKCLKNVPNGRMALYTPKKEHIDILHQAYFQSLMEISNEMNSAIESFSKVPEHSAKKS
jgi:anti-anti-sigma factor